jgi:membrane-bound lytic murein transglycosylase D
MDIIPAKDRSFILRLPLDAVGDYIDKEKEIFAYKDSVFFNPKNAITPSRFNASYQYDVPPGSIRYVYRVKEGDVLGKIAERHGVSVGQLRSWNNIRRNLIRVGQKLVIYIPERTANKMGIKGEKSKTS